MSTKAKGSKSSAKPRKPASAPGSGEPKLSIAYRQAVSFTCGLQANFIRIDPLVFPKFRARQARLDEMGIAYDTYAYSVIKTWWSWAQKHNLKTVPVNLFLGPKAWDRFVEQIQSTVRLNTKSQEAWSDAVHAEFMAARAFIGAHAGGNIMVTIGDCRKALGLDNSVDPEVVQEVVGLFGMLYDMEVEKYEDISSELMRRRIGSEKMDKLLGVKSANA